MFQLAFLELSFMLNYQISMMMGVAFDCILSRNLRDMAGTQYHRDAAASPCLPEKVHFPPVGISL